MGMFLLRRITLENSLILLSQALMPCGTKSHRVDPYKSDKNMMHFSEDV